MDGASYPLSELLIRLSDYPQWIKCSDRLPEKNRWVLCYLPNLFYEESKIFSLQFFIYTWSENEKLTDMPIFKNIDRSYRLDDVSHWMPLPAPPKD